MASLVSMFLHFWYKLTQGQDLAITQLQIKWNVFTDFHSFRVLKPTVLSCSDKTKHSGFHVLPCSVLSWSGLLHKIMEPK